MFGAQDFRQCVADNLAGKRYGDKRKKEILAVYDRFELGHLDSGESPTRAALMAMTDTNNEMVFLARDEAKKAAKAFSVFMDTQDRIMQAFDTKTGFLGKASAGHAMGQAAKSMIQQDRRFKGTDFVATSKGYRDKYWALMSNVMDNFSKGAFGRQIGTAHLTNIVRELYGVDSGDTAAKEIATAYRKVQDVMVDDFNQAGGSLRKMARFILPQTQNAVKVAQSYEDWAKSHESWLDWDAMRWPDGQKIKPDEHAQVLKAAYTTLATEGAIKIDERAFQGRGRSIGDQLDKHRFLIYKDQESWHAMHEKYGDGSVFDVIERHIEQMAHKTALVQMFGRNPETWRRLVKAIAEKQAAIAQETARTLGTNKVDLTSVIDVNSAMGKGGIFDSMFDSITHANHMDPHSRLAGTIVTTSNLVNSSVGGSITLVAMPADIMTTLGARFINHMPLISGLGSYLAGMVTPGAYGNLQRIIARAGFVFDEHVSSHYAMQRLTGVQTFGVPLSRRLSDITMRASLLTRHTNILRGTAIKEFMGMLDEYRTMDFDQLPFKPMMEAYGITARDWKVMGKVQAWSPDGGRATFMRPLDVLETNLIDRDQLYRKFQNLIYNEVRNMVPDATLEAAATLKLGTRPDTLAGALLHSFAMYKNFGVTLFQQYGRLAMSEQSLKRRLSFVVGLGLGLIGSGALTVQLRELAHGRTPLPMNTLEFWGKAILTSGSLGIWGDFLFGGTVAAGRSPQEQIAGPIGGLIGDTANLFLADVPAVSKWLQSGEDISEFHAKFGARLTAFLRRELPGSNIWWANLVLQHEIADRVQDWTDPKAEQKRRAKVRAQERGFGNTYWLRPGESMFQGDAR